MSNLQISHIKQSTLATDARVTAALAYLQKQMSEDFAVLGG